MSSIENNSKYELYNKLCDGFQECQIVWSNQNIIAVPTFVKTIDEEKKKSFDKFIDRNETKINLSSCSRIEKSSYYHKSEISEDGNYLASINKDGLL